MKNFISLVLIMFVMSSCSLFKKAQEPPHDQQVQDLTGTILNQSHDMYENMKAATDKSFATWKPSYDSLSTELQNLVTLDLARKNNTVVLKQANDWLTLLNTYEAEHQNYGSLNIGQIQSYEDGINDRGKIVYNTESNLK